MSATFPSFSSSAGALPKMLSMIRFSHTLFALPFALLSAIMAWSLPHPAHLEAAFSWRQLAGILVCMVGARSAAMSFNRLADRRLDALNPRTAGRHLPAGLLSVSSVTLFMLASCAVFIAGTLFFLPNFLPLCLALPVLAFLLGYSYAKRFTALAHFWLGIALALAPLCAWLAIRGAIVLAAPADLIPPFVLACVVALWVTGFDIVYACQDADFDRQTKLHSVPALVGITVALKIAAACHVAMLIALALLPFFAPQLALGSIWWLGFAIVAPTVLSQHILVRPNDFSRLNLAFFYVNVAVGFLLLCFGALDLLT